MRAPWASLRSTSGRSKARRNIGRVATMARLLTLARRWTTPTTRRVIRRISRPVETSRRPRSWLVGFPGRLRRRAGGLTLLLSALLPGAGHFEGSAEPDRGYRRVSTSDGYARAFDTQRAGLRAEGRGRVNEVCGGVELTTCLTRRMAPKRLCGQKRGCGTGWVRTEV